MLLVSAAIFAREVTIAVGAGENWKSKMDPQFAVWVEDADGNYIETLYITNKASRKSWIFGPKEGRPESLPVWYHAAKNNPAVEKAGAAESARASGDSDAGIDAVTSATPKGGVTFKASIPDDGCVVKAEFNTSFDYNSFYTKKNSGVNGQPSVIYGAKISAGQKEEAALEFLGTGSLDGSDGKISDEIINLTTARKIVKLVTISF